MTKKSLIIYALTAVLTIFCSAAAQAENIIIQDPGSRYHQNIEGGGDIQVDLGKSLLIETKSAAYFENNTGYKVVPSIRAELFDVSSTDDPSIDHERLWAPFSIGLPWISPSLTGEGIKIAVIDSGVERNHPDLNSVKIELGTDYIDQNNLYENKDYHRHGTRVTGVIGARNNMQGVRGVSPGATVLSIKVFGASRDGTNADIVAAIHEAVSKDADVINLSLGFEYPAANAPQYEKNDFITVVSSLEEALKYAVDNGVTPVCATGNAGGDTLYPAASSYCIAVGGAYSYNEEVGFWNSSNYGGVPYPGCTCTHSGVDFIAPSAQVHTTSEDGSYVYAHGTSFAAPHVSGAIALALQEDADHAMERSEIDAKLRKGALIVDNNYLPSINTPNEKIGWGFIQLDQIFDTPRPPMVPQLISTPQLSTPTGSLQVNHSGICTQGTWRYTSDSTSYTYIWKRDGQIITSGPGSFYTFQDADVNKRITCEVRAQNAHGQSLSAISNSVGPIVARPIQNQTHAPGETTNSTLAENQTGGGSSSCISQSYQTNYLTSIVMTLSCGPVTKLPRGKLVTIGAGKWLYTPAAKFVGTDIFTSGGMTHKINVLSLASKFTVKYKRLGNKVTFNLAADKKLNGEKVIYKWQVYVRGKWKSEGNKTYRIQKGKIVSYKTRAKGPKRRLIITLQKNTWHSSKTVIVNYK